LLRLLAEHEIRATFFVLGWIADRFPALIREVVRAGHEIGSHSYWHRLIYTLSPDEFREDLRCSRDILEDLLGSPVRAYRAPSFSITRDSLWALDILEEEGFRCDSSIFPVHHDRYGIPGAQRFPHTFRRGRAELYEFPPTTYCLGKATVPVGGGGYFRLYPLAWTCRMLAHVNRVCRQPFMFYIHPWELDPDQPRMGGISPATRFRHYVNLDKTETKLGRLFESFRFAPMSEVLLQLGMQIEPVLSPVADLCSIGETPLAVGDVCEL
jgi:polysaccharide deacetylase family protein (PEP-CTERM system associated)